MDYVARGSARRRRLGHPRWIACKMGRDDRDPLLLHIKAAEGFGARPFLGHAANSQITRPRGRWAATDEATSGILLGRVSGSSGVDGKRYDYSACQPRDWKDSAETEQ